MNIVLLLKTFAIIAGVYVISKLLAPYFLDFFAPSRPKREHDLEDMIKRKMDYLRVTGSANQNPSQTQATSSSVKKTKNTKIDFPDLVNQHFQKLSQTQNKNDIQLHKQAELKKTLSLLDALQWGQSEELSGLRRRFAKYFDFAPDETTLLKAVRLCLVHAPLVDEKLEPKPYDDLADCIIAATMHDIFRSTFTVSPSNDINTLAKRWHTNPIELQKAWLFWLHTKAQVNNDHFVAELIKHQGTFSASDLMTLTGFGPDGLPWTKMISENSRPRRGPELVESMREELTTMQAIAEIPSAETITRAQALFLMGFEDIPAPGILSRRYKKLARLMHPDRLSSRGFPAIVMDKASDNFRTLKAAYDLLKEETE